MVAILLTMPGKCGEYGHGTSTLLIAWLTRSKRVLADQYLPCLQVLASMLSIPSQ